MLPHTGPSGGDWSINRFAAVVVEGAEGFTITGCTFSRLDNAAVFLGGCVSRAVQFHPHGDQFDFVWLPARTPHGGALYVW